MKYYEKRQSRVEVWIHLDINSFILEIYIAPRQEIYSGALPAQPRQNMRNIVDYSKCILTYSVAPRETIWKESLDCTRISCKLLNLLWSTFKTTTSYLRLWLRASSPVCCLAGHLNWNNSSRRMVSETMASAAVPQSITPRFRRSTHAPGRMDSCTVYRMFLSISQATLPNTQPMQKRGTV